ncbi:hypothetical protein [Nissabacter sp. SGAir0207]|nr:hypothetical protein [Nissabacter sp. SGAir0207]
MTASSAPLTGRQTWLMASALARCAATMLVLAGVWAAITWANLLP